MIAAFAGLLLQNLPCQQVTMRWGDIPVQEVRCVYVEDIATPYVYSTPNDMIVGVKIGQPRDDWDNNCGRNYTVSLSQGVLAVDFNDAGSYYLELTHSSGAVSHGNLEVLTYYLSSPQAGADSHSEGKPPTGPARKRRIEVDYTKKWIFAVTADPTIELAYNHDPKIVHKRRAVTGTIAEFQQLVCELYDECGGTMPIKLHVFAHGVNITGVGPPGGRVRLGPAYPAPPSITPANARAYGEAVAGKVCHTNWGVCYSARNADGLTFLQEFAQGSQAACTGATGSLTYSLDDCWDWSEFAMVPCLKLTVDDGEIIERHPTSQLQVENTIEGSAPAKVRLPLGYGKAGVDPVIELWSAVGQSRSEWDLDLDGDVDGSDLSLLLQEIGD